MLKYFQTSICRVAHRLLVICGHPVSKILSTFTLLYLLYIDKHTYTSTSYHTFTIFKHKKYTPFSIKCYSEFSIYFKQGGVISPLAILVYIVT